jgi:hypothetical protein
MYICIHANGQHQPALQQRCMQLAEQDLQQSAIADNLQG